MRRSNRSRALLGDMSKDFYGHHHNHQQGAARSFCGCSDAENTKEVERILPVGDAARETTKPEPEQENNIDRIKIRHRADQRG